MRSIHPIPIEKFDFSPYGQYYNFRSNISLQQKGIHSVASKEPVMLQPMRLGITVCGGGTFVCRSMERHISTQELLFPGNSSLVLAVANSDPEGFPQEDDIAAIIFQSGDLIVLSPGIWHDACRALEGETMYYFMANNDGSPRETEWISVSPGPVLIQMDK